MAVDADAAVDMLTLWPLLCAAFVLCSSPFLTLVYVLWRTSRKSPKVRSVAVVVLGDIGRSPRMMYHAESFAQAQFDTWIIGYRGQHSRLTSNVHASADALPRASRLPSYRLPSLNALPLCCTTTKVH